jgi:hypothetical protein
MFTLIMEDWRTHIMSLITCPSVLRPLILQCFRLGPPPFCLSIGNAVGCVLTDTTSNGQRPCSSNIPCFRRTHYQAHLSPFPQFRLRLTTHTPPHRAHTAARCHKRRLMSLNAGTSDLERAIFQPHPQCGCWSLFPSSQKRFGYPQILTWSYDVL